jgi:dihydroorotate dehydrogenase
MKVLNASGCLDALEAPEVARVLDVFVTKTVTPQPREGNRPVRIAETDAGMLNSIGLENPGIDGLLRDKLPRLSELGVPLWVSVGGFAASDYAELCAALDRAQPLVPERRRGARERRRARRRSSPADSKTALRQAFARGDRPR